jgi:hypothetical protein
METTLTDVINRKLESKLNLGKERVQDLIIRLQNEIDSTRDFITPFTRKNNDVTFINDGGVRMKFQNENVPFAIHAHALGQMAAKIDIPSSYLRELATGDEEHRDLAVKILSSHKNWTEEDRRLLIRSVDHEVRGVLSDSYKRLNSKMILNQFFNTVKSSEARVADAHYTDTKFWIEALIPYVLAIPTEMNGMAHVVFGVRLGNSDFGDGSLDIRSFMMQPVCTNGMVRESLMNKVHLGKKLPDNIALSNETYMYESKMITSAVKDVTMLALDSKQIRENVAMITKAGSTGVNLEREFLNLATKQITKNEIVEISKIMSQDNPEDGIFGEASLWKLTQGITAHGRNIGGRREREMAQLAGELLQRVKVA